MEYGRDLVTLRRTSYQLFLFWCWNSQHWTLTYCISWFNHSSKLSMLVILPSVLQTDTEYDVFYLRRFWTAEFFQIVPIIMLCSCPWLHVTDLNLCRPKSPVIVTTLNTTSFGHAQRLYGEQPTRSRVTLKSLDFSRSPWRAVGNQPNLSSGANSRNAGVAGHVKTQRFQM